MKQTQIRQINIYRSETKSSKPISDCVGEFHLQFVQQTLNQMKLCKKDKLAVIDGIIKNLKAA